MTHRRRLLNVLIALGCRQVTRLCRDHRAGERVLSQTLIRAPKFPHSGLTGARHTHWVPDEFPDSSSLQLR